MESLFETIFWLVIIVIWIVAKVKRGSRGGSPINILPTPSREATPEDSPTAPEDSSYKAPADEIAEFFKRLQGEEAPVRPAAAIEKAPAFEPVEPVFVAPEEPAPLEVDEIEPPEEITPEERESGLFPGMEELSEMQMAIVLTEILGPPRAKRRSRII